jgi:hypothetical protein
MIESPQKSVMYVDRGLRSAVTSAVKLTTHAALCLADHTRLLM